MIWIRWRRPWLCVNTMTPSAALRCSTSHTTTRHASPQELPRLHGYVDETLALKGTLKETYAGLWVGTCFAVGLSVGGMVRPSVVINALAPVRFDATLWVLFMTALATTFGLYRVASAVGVSGASCLAPGSSQGAIDAKLLTGAALFGLGWGTGGVCPGPQLVSLAADPTADDPDPAVVGRLPGGPGPSEGVSSPSIPAGK